MSTAADRGWGHPGVPGESTAATYRREHIVLIDVGGVRLYVRREVAPIFSAFLQRAANGGYSLADHADDWGYICRPIRGYEDEWRRTRDLRYLSNHSWGLAIDINARDNPMTSDGRVVTTLPQWLINMALDLELDWGGFYTGKRKDPMHFEWLGSPADAARVVRSLAEGPHYNTPEDEEDEMALAKDDDDLRRAWVREQCWAYWGIGPTVDEQNILVYNLAMNGKDLTLAAITDHAKAKAFRTRRGW